MLDYYLKVFIDENSQHIAYFGYKEYFEDKTELLKTRVFPLDVLGEKEPKILELVAGPVIGVYYERISKDNAVCETQYGFKVEGISEDTIDYLDALCKEIVLESKYDDLYVIDDSEIPTDIQVMINNNEKGAALLRIAEVIGQDDLERIDEDTIYFIINTLNQLNIGLLRNRILLKVLPLKV